MALHQHVFAQSLLGSAGHAVRSGITEQQPDQMPEIAKYTSGMPGPPKFEDKLEEREFLKGRLAAAFRVRTSLSRDLASSVLCADLPTSLY